MQVYQNFKQVVDKMERALKSMYSPKNDWKTNKIDAKTELSVKVTNTNIELRYEGLLSTSI